jgi:lipopolysaccharide heptosyltransferase II
LDAKERRPPSDVAGEPAAGRVLVKAVNWLGDLVMSLPALRAVRQAYPNAHLAVLVKSDLASFFDGAQWIDDVIPYTIRRGAGGLVDRRALVADIRARRFDLAILFPRSFEAALWVALARVPRRAGFATDARGPLLTHKVGRDPTLLMQHQMHEYLHMLRATLHIAAGDPDPTLEVHEPNRVHVRAWLERVRRIPGGKLIALAVSAAYGPAKEWPAEHYAELIDVLGQTHNAECILVGARGERAKCERVAALSHRGALIGAGEHTVGESIALLSLCDGFVGNDSGAMHVAAAVGIPTLGLYGSTNPARTGPVGARARVIYRQIECAPCLQRTCRFGHYHCLTQITPIEVVAELQALGALG